MGLTADNTTTEPAYYGPCAKCQQVHGGWEPCPTRATPTPVTISLALASDYILLEREAEVTPKVELLDPRHADREPIIRARVVACGPGEMRPDGGLYPMPCEPGDTVLVMASAGTRAKVGGVEFWFVYAQRKDIVGVVHEVPAA